MYCMDIYIVCLFEKSHDTQHYRMTEDMHHQFLANVSVC